MKLAKFANVEAKETKLNRVWSNAANAVKGPTDYEAGSFIATGAASLVPPLQRWVEAVNW